MQPLPSAAAAVGFADNTGPHRLRQLRREARDEGLSPNVWLDNVELVAARRVGRETVNCASNIFRWYGASGLPRGAGAGWVHRPERGTRRGRPPGLRNLPLDSSGRPGSYGSSPPLTRFSSVPAATASSG
jgi:hypothetical protein